VGTEISRGAFLRRGGVAVAALAGVSAVDARLALGGSAEPKPIPGGFGMGFQAVEKNPAFHVFQPLKGGELNSISDFSGFVAATEIQGKATGSDGTKYSYDCDMRFMQGDYLDLGGQIRHGTFGFI
jgi:hypothetical protein